VAEAWSEEAFDEARARAKTGVVDAQGVHLREGQLARLITRLPRAGERPRATRIDLADAVVEGDANFDGFAFDGAARFDGAAFTGAATFRGATFAHDAAFSRARFEADACFAGASFARARFEGARFEGDATFEKARCERIADFELAHFGGNADFREVDLDAALFSMARFSGMADFREARLRHGSFARAAFVGNATFSACVFAQLADFGDATFAGYAFFSDCRFEGPAHFQGSLRIAGDAWFDRAAFSQEALFAGARFEREATFARASFAGFTQFAGASFADQALFGDARFAGDVDLGMVTCGGQLSLSRARFPEARMIGPLLVDDWLTLDHATFDAPVRIEAAARVVSCDAAMFHAGVDLFTRWADISAEGADFAGASLVAALPAAATLGDEGGFLGDERPGDGRRWVRESQPTEGYEPRVVSLRRAKVARLTLSRVDLSGCRFASSHGLDELRLEQVQFAQPPTGWRQRGRRWGRWTRRRTIAEEHRWRSRHGHGSGWYEPPVRGPDWLDDASEALEPAQISSIYRSLRRGRERERDEPGASDLYYGEMEMRRMYARRRRTWSFVRPVESTERAILWLYWLVSGYGLRASRAFASLALVIALLAIPLTFWGFDPTRGYGRALLFAAESSISLLRVPEAKLTAAGEVTQIALRLAGPLFFGLAVLALRSRVRR